MKFQYIIFALIIVLSSCSKKVTDTTAMQDTKEMVEIDDSFRATVPDPGPARKIQIGKAETFDLDNGLTVIVVENNKIPRVSYQLSLRNDPILEGEQAGYVSFAGDLLSRGTSTRTKAEIDEAIDFIGASLSTSSGGVFASALTKHSDALLDIFTDVLYNPAFPEEELEKMRTQTLSGLEATKTNADAMVGNVVATVNYGTSHPYGEVQTIESTKKITLDQCRSYYDRFFIPNNAYLTIVGDITLEEAKATANKYFGKWKKRPFKPVVNKKVPVPEDRNVAIANKDGAVQSVIRVTYPIDLEPGHPDNVKVALMNEVLGGSSSARLFQNLREDKAYTYGAYSSLSADPIIGRYSASASVRTEVTDSSVMQFLFEMERIRNEIVDEQELQSMKNYRTGSFARALESPQTIARFALNTIRYDLADDYYQTYLERMNKVTPSEIQMMAQKYILPEKANIVVVGDKDAISDALVHFDSDGQIDYYDPFGREVEYNSVVPTDATAESVIEDYLAAIGGKSAIKALKTVATTMSSEMMGQSLTINILQKAPNKFAMKVGNGDMVFQEQKYDGEKGMSSAMGQKQVITEGPQLEALKAQAKIVPQIDYLSGDYTLELAGVETVEGKQCYKIQIADASGNKTSEFYSLEDGLLVRMVGTQEGMGQEVTITTDFSDYRAYDNISFPSQMKISGAMPMPMVMKVTGVEVNKEIGDETFLISRN